jgi:glyoxylase-like metal-dependent hydrolase (beta-lactamase superfamily II)
MLKPISACEHGLCLWDPIGRVLMIENIMADLYKIEVPLFKSPLKALNSYVIKSQDRNLVVDTGWNQKECLNTMQKGLKQLGVDIRKTDFFITHLHSDHLGLVSDLITDTSRIYFNQPDADRFHSGIPLDDFIAFARLNGYPEDELQEVIHSHPGFKFRTKGDLVFHILKEGDRIGIGDYQFQCIETPGHTKGHMCLYEPQKKIFVAGDLLLKDITPNIQLWSDEWDPLKEYLTSLDKVDRFDIELVLPGHRTIFRDYKKRIQELKDHHQKRLEEIISILEKGRKNAFQVASQMSWDITYDSWDLFPMTQKWFAIGEAISHLKYLEGKKRIRKEREGGKIFFSIHTIPPRGRT